MKKPIIIAAILLILAWIFYFIYPKDMTTLQPPYYTTYEKCECLGVTKFKSIDHDLEVTSCFGLIHSCKLGSKLLMDDLIRQGIIQ